MSVGLNRALSQLNPACGLSANAGRKVGSPIDIQGYAQIARLLVVALSVVTDPLRAGQTRHVGSGGDASVKPPRRAGDTVNTEPKSSRRSGCGAAAGVAMSVNCKGALVVFPKTGKTPLGH